MLLRAGSFPQGHRSSPSGLCVSRPSFCSRSLVVMTVMQEVFTVIGDVLQWCTKESQMQNFVNVRRLSLGCSVLSHIMVTWIFSGIGSYCPCCWSLGAGASFSVKAFEWKWLQSFRHPTLFSTVTCTHREASFSISHFRVQHELCLGSTNPAVPVSAVQTQQFLFRQYKPSSSCLGSTNPAVLLLHTMGQFHAPSFFYLRCSLGFSCHN